MRRILVFQLTTAACSEKTSPFLVASSGCPEIQALIAGARIPRSLLPTQKPPLQQITSVLRQRAELRHPVNTLHLLAHGRPGAFRFGEQWIDADALKAHANELASWGVDTIALWSCRVGADANFVALLEELTGARVLASADWLGRVGGVEQSQLGDWRLSDLVEREIWPVLFRLEDLDDELIGSDTADELDGGKGDDSLIGGEGRDDFELSDGNDLILDFEDDIDVISVSNFKDLSLEQDGDDVLIRRGDQQTRVLNSTVNVVADSLVRVDARLESNPLNESQRDDLRTAFRRLLAGKAVNAGAIGTELSKDQKKGLLRSLRSVMNRDPLVSNDALSQLSNEQKQDLITELKQLLNGHEIAKDQLRDVFTRDEKQALGIYLKNVLVASDSSKANNVPELDFYFSETEEYRGMFTGNGIDPASSSMVINLFHPCYADPAKCGINAYPDPKHKPLKNFWDVNQNSATDVDFYISKFEENRGKPVLNLYGDWDDYSFGSSNGVTNFIGKIQGLKFNQDERFVSFPGLKVDCIDGDCDGMERASQETGVRLQFDQDYATNVPDESIAFRSIFPDPIDVDIESDGECERSSFDGYFGYLEGSNDKALFARDWLLYEELGVNRVDVSYLDMPVGEIPDGWNIGNNDSTGNRVAAELEIFYDDGKKHPYEFHGWLDAKYKSKQQLHYAYFYLAEIVDENGVDVSIEDLNISQSGLSYVPVINDDLESPGQSVFYLYQDTGTYQPGSGEATGNAQFWGSSISPKKRRGKYRVGGGDKSGLDLDDLCGEEVPPPPIEDPEVSIDLVEGTGICADDEFLFEVNGESEGIVSFDLTLGEDPLPEGTEIEYSNDGGKDDSWKNYETGELRRLSGEGDGYLKVQLPPQSAEGQSLNVQVKQHDIQLDPDTGNPIVDVQYQMLNFDNAVPLPVGDKDGSIWLDSEGKSIEPFTKQDPDDLDNPEARLPLGPTDPWSDVPVGTQVKNAYRFPDLLPNDLGFELQADVSLEFDRYRDQVQGEDKDFYKGGNYLRQFVFDSNQKLKSDPDKPGLDPDPDYKKRFQPRFGEAKQQEITPEKVSFDFKFYLAYENTDERKEVFLKNFWVNAADLDTVMGNYKASEFLSFPSDLKLVWDQEDADSIAAATAVYTLPEGNGAPGERGPSSGYDDLNCERIENSQGVPWVPYNPYSTKAQFSWVKVITEPNNEDESIYAYDFQFSGQPVVDGYKSVIIRYNYIIAVENDEGEDTDIVEDGGLLDPKGGKISLKPKVKSLYFYVDVEPNQKLSGKEFATLRLKGEEGTQGGDWESVPMNSDPLFYPPLGGGGRPVCEYEGKKNMIQKPVEEGDNTFLGAKGWNLFQYNEYNYDKFSIHPAGSVLLDYKEPVDVLSFDAGTTGKLDIYKYKSDGSGGMIEGGTNPGNISSVANIPVSIGNIYTEGDFEPSGDIQQDEVSVPLEECVDGLVEDVTASGACIDEDDAKVALFTFDIKLKGSYNNDGQTYYYKFEGNKVLGDDYEIQEIYIDNEAKGKDYLSAEGEFDRPDGADEEFSVQVEIKAPNRLDGTEALKLTLDNQADLAPGRSPSDVAKIENFDECAIDGLVEDVTASGACIDEDDAKVALFTFDIKLKGSYNNDGQTYYYKFEGNKVLGDDYEIQEIYIDNEAKGKDYLSAEGEFDRPDGADEEFSVQVEIKAPNRLDGTEALKLTLDNQADLAPGRSPSDVAKIENFDECAIDGLVEDVTASGACIDEDDAKVALFTFDIKLKGSYNNDGQTYYYKFEGNKVLGDDYEIQEIYIDNEAKGKDYLSAEGEFDRPDGADEEFSVQVEIKAPNRLDGTEALKLTLDNQADLAPGRSPSDVAKIENFDECAIDGLVEDVTASGACIDEDDAKVALFTFDIKLKGSYNNDGQTYYYKFEGNKVLGDDYEIQEIYIDNEAKGKDYLSAEGEFDRPDGADEEFSVQVEIKAPNRLDGTEALKLTLDNQADLAPGRSPSDVAKIENFDECAIDGLVEDVTASGACIDEDDAKVALFTFDIKLKGSYNNDGQTYYYKFEGNKVLGDDYEIQEIYIDNEAKGKDYLSAEGEFDRPDGADEEFSVQVEIKAPNRLDGTEALKLTLDNQADLAPGRSPSDVAKIENFDECAIDGLVEDVTASGACIDEDDAKVALFTFDIKLKGSYNNDGQTYYYKFEGNKVLGDDYEIQEIYIDNEAKGKDYLSAEGEFDRPDGADEEFSVQVEIKAPNRLDGTEALKLTLDNQADLAPGRSPSDVAKIENFDECAIDGLVEDVTASGACIDEDDAKVALFTFDIKLKGSYNNDGQTYYYKFEGNKVLGDDYEIQEIYIDNEAKGKDYLSAEGEFDRPDGADEEFSVQVEIKAPNRLDGTEALKLTLDNQADLAPGRSPSDVAKIENFDECAIDGLVEDVTASGACIDEDDAKVALFTFDIKLKGSYNNDGQTYYYKFEGNKVLGDDYEIQEIYIDNEAKGKDYLSAEGEFDRPDGADEEFSVQVEIKAPNRLDGTEALKLTLDNQADLAPGRSPSDVAKIENFDECAIDGLVEDVTASGACIDEDDAKVALFTFDIKLKGSYNNDGQTYYYKFEGNKVLGDDYEIQEIYIDNEAKGKDYLSAEGEFDRPDGADEEFSVQVEIKAPNRLDGTEALKLTLDNQADLAPGRSPSDVAKIENFDECAIDGLVEDVTASGACIDEDDAKVALFTFDIKLKGSYNNDGQTYYYKFEGNKVLGDDYEIQEIYIDNEAKGKDYLSAEGEFDRPDGADEEFSVQVEIKAPNRLDGTEALKLTLDNQADLAPGRSPSDVAKIENFDECAIDGSVRSIKASAACIDDGDQNKATFTFDAELNSSYNQRGQVFSYRFDSDASLADGYEVVSVYVNGENQANFAKQGSFEVAENNFTPVSELSVQVEIRAAQGLDGTEALTLTLDHVSTPEALDKDSPSATASLKDFSDCPPALDSSTDVSLYLLMDNSTSMLLPDPSTDQAEQKDRLEGQDRVSLYAFEQAISKAGYGFSRQGEDVVLTSEQFRDALINNSTDSIRDVLDGFEVVVDPDFEGKAKDVSVNLITYGYVVDYGQLSFDQQSTEQAINIAKTIVDVETPDQIYGNSIKDNTIWTGRDLPNPEQKDLFQGQGRLSPNLYSGTEMLGALQGLEHLLSAQAKSRDADEFTTLVSMVTDGRPERRSWWDTRTSAGSDSITGVSVPLPDALGGDSITTSGLAYDADGNHTFLENNRGQKQWKQMQRQLNKALDSIAARSDNPAEALQVEVMAMGDGSDANFPAIYADLFGNRTFDNSTGGWSYDVFNSFGLPDFLG